MISFSINGHRFHYRAGAIVLDAGHVLLHRLQGDTFWALPGGRVDPGEEATAAIVREFREELGTTIECGALVCTGENFFDYETEPHHEVGLYFHAALPIASPLRDKEHSHIGVEGDKRLEFKWFPTRDLLAIDIRPKALRVGLTTGHMPSHFVQRD